MTELPHSVDAEIAVLGSIMLRPDSLAMVSDWLSVEDFYIREHAMVYSAVAELSRKGQPCDPVTVGEWFEAQGLSEFVSFAFVCGLTQTPVSAANIVAHAEIVAERSRLRRAIDIGDRLKAAALASGADSAQLMAIAQQELAQYQAATVRTGLKPAKAAVRGFVAGVQARYSNGPGLIGIPTPWQGVNACTRGLRPGTLYVVGARPGMGKSIFGFQLAAFSALRGVRVGLFSVEMGEDEVIGRMVACAGELEHEWIEQPAENDDEAHWSRFTDVTTRLAESGLLIDDTPALKIEQLTARAKRAHMQSKLGLVVIDHLHDLAFDGSEEMRFKIGKAVQGAKSLAKDLGVPVVLLAQLNRNVAGRSDKTPTMIDLRESGEIEQKADVIFFLHRDDYYDTDKEKTHLQGVVKLIPAKGRNLRLKETIHLENQFAQMRMVDWVGPLPQKPEDPPPSKRGIGIKDAKSYAAKDYER